MSLKHKLLCYHQTWCILQALSKVQTSAEKGTFWQQFSAVLALRMTPVIPFR